MATETEKYQVETEYTVTDKATAALRAMERGFKAAGHELHGLKEKFAEFRSESRLMAASMLGVGFGLGAWFEKAKEATGGFERARKSMAGLMAETMNFPSHMSGIERYNASTKMATEITESLENTVRQYGGTLDEATAGFKQLTASVAPMHLTQEQLLGLYGKVAAAAKVSGMDQAQAAEIAGRAIMTGAVRPVGVLGKMLYQALHAHGKLTKQMTGAARIKLVEGALGEQAPIADLMSQAIPDNLRRIQMDVEKVFRRLAGPVFGAVSKELKSWAEHLEKAEKGSRPLIDIWGDKLKGAFMTIKDVSGFLVDHWKVLAGIWATFKVGSMAGGAAGALGSIGQAIGGGIGGAMGMFGKGLADMAGAMGPVVMGLGLFKIALDALLSWVDQEIDKGREITTHGVAMSGAAGVLQHLAGIGAGPLSAQQERFGAGAVKELIKSGALNQAGAFDRGAAIANVAHLDNATKERLADELGIRVKGLPVSQMAATQFADALANKLAPILAAHPEFLPGAKKAEAATEVDTSKLKTKGTQIGPFTGPITIQQKFDDVDPDRVWIGTKRGIEEEAERRTTSVYSHPFGE